MHRYRSNFSVIACIVTISRGEASHGRIKSNFKAVKRSRCNMILVAVVYLCCSSSWSSRANRKSICLINSYHFNTASWLYFLEQHSVMGCCCCCVWRLLSSLLIFPFLILSSCFRQKTVRVVVLLLFLTSILALLVLLLLLLLLLLLVFSIFILILKTRWWW